MNAWAPHHPERFPADACREERSGVEYGPEFLGEGHKAKPSTLCQGRQARGETVFVTLVSRMTSRPEDKCA